MFSFGCDRSIVCVCADEITLSVSPYLLIKRCRRLATEFSQIQCQSVHLFQYIRACADIQSSTATHHGDLGPLTSSVDVPDPRALRSAGTNRLVVPPVRLATVGSRAFPVAAAHTWNSLPEHTVSASTLQSLKRLKTFLLQQFFRLAL